ncbi:MAG: ATP-binding domain-containing protein [Betaproteobacteria bacterium]|nr:ATP-binding domain-containing protein [Betaproteobacteria bacterium]
MMIRKATNSDGLLRVTPSCEGPIGCLCPFELSLRDWEVRLNPHIQAIAAGFRKDMIAVVSFRGREGSALGAFDQLGGHRLRRFTGGYDAGGSPVYSEGEVLLDSVYRFKGRRAPCVILTEIDFEALGEIEMRKIFLGATRATMKLSLVMSEGAAGVETHSLERHRPTNWL